MQHKITSEERHNWIAKDQWPTKFSDLNPRLPCLGGNAKGLSQVPSQTKNNHQSERYVAVNLR